MNAEDIQLMRTIISQIDDLSNGNRLLFSVNYTRIAKTNLILLKALLEELNEKGLFVTIDRPHQYMEHLLRMHHIDNRNLLFIDTIARYSGSRMGGKDYGVNVRFVDSPFQIDLLPDLFSLNPEGAGRAVGKIDIRDVDFILIDNIASMLNYNDANMVEKFLENYLAKFRGMNNIFIPLILDRTTYSSLYQAARRLCDMEMDIEKLKERKGGRDDEWRRKSLLTDNKSAFDLDSYRKCFSGGN